MPNTDASDDSWRRNGRPVSTIARSFSATLDNAFLLHPGLDELSQSVAQKQQAVSTRQSELQDLEARLRETEARLQNRQASPSSVPPSITSGRNNRPTGPGCVGRASDVPTEDTRDVDRQGLRYDAQDLHDKNGSGMRIDGRSDPESAIRVENSALHNRGWPKSSASRSYQQSGHDGMPQTGGRAPG